MKVRLSVSMAKKVGLSLLLASLVVTSINCGSGGDNQPNTTSALYGYHGRLVYQTTMSVTDEFVNGLTDEDKKQLLQAGVQIKNRTLLYPDQPAAGVWIRLGGQEINTNADGMFSLKSLPVGVTTAEVYRQLTDDKPITTFALAGNLLPSNQTSKNIPVVLSLHLPGEMNPPTTRQAGIASHTRANCTLRDVSACANNLKGCCLDFDNPEGDGKAYARSDEIPDPLNDCDNLAVKNWKNSTCYRWSFGGIAWACALESAYGNPFGKNCWTTHKYRNCQHMSIAQDAFKITPEADLSVTGGGTLDLQVYNNTPGNDTKVTLQEPNSVTGTLTGDGLVGTTLQHYSDPDTKHYETRTLTFHAPKDEEFPAGKTEITVTLTATSYSRTITRYIKVCRCVK